MTANVFSLSHIRHSWPFFMTELRSYFTRKILGCLAELDEEKIQRFSAQIPQVIDKMTKAEQDHPEVILESERIGQIATKSGVAPEEVRELIRWFLELRTQSIVFPPRKADETQELSERCARVHSPLIAGRCPWCGKNMFPN